MFNRTFTAQGQNLEGNIQIKVFSSTFHVQVNTRQLIDADYKSTVWLSLSYIVIAGQQATAINVMIYYTTELHHDRFENWFVKSPCY